ncbi:MAG: thiosulfate sulfurtransferase [Desulfobacteraceae bacterium]|nr:thiosulfate sulfurtransferase [Desulfobacteraceae bacterium]
MKTITPVQLKDMLHDKEELALLDLREQGAFSKEHQLFACCIPLSHLELKLRDLVPRQTTRIVLVDQGKPDELRLAERGAERLTSWGYSSVAILEGGIEGWRTAGYELFSGVNVLSKVFGEFVEVTYDTPRLTAEALKAKLDRGQNLVILDARPQEEYQRMSIPGGIDSPGAELVYRVHDVAPDPATTVVVNCAGRTRSIIGAQSLINAGIPNPVAALKDGTMGWQLAGFELEYGQKRHAPTPSAVGMAKAQACAARVAKRFGVKKVNRDTLNAWADESETRTLYVLDVRSPKEFEAGHLEGARNAPGGQLVQATDEYVAVRNARLVLVDDNEVRATMTASWLIQMGWTDIYVLAGGMGDGPLVQGSHKWKILGLEMGDTITPLELKGMLDSGEHLAVVDLATSVQYKNHHIPGAWWGVRSRLDSDLSHVPSTDFLILTSPDGLLAHLSVKEIEANRSGSKVRVLDGGSNAWIAAGLPTSEGMERPISEADDVWYKPYEQTDAPYEAMRDYLTWEVALLEKLERDGDANFRTFTGL